MNSNPYLPAVESLLFVSPQPITKADLKYCIENSLSVSLDPEIIEQAIDQITNRYLSDDFGIELKEIAGGYQFLSKPAHFQVVAEHIKMTNRKNCQKQLWNLWQLLPINNQFPNLKLSRFAV